MRARRSSGGRPSFETRRCATLLWMRRFRHADSRLAHEPLAVVSNSRCQTAQSSSFPRRVAAPGLVPCICVHPRSRGGRSADRRTRSVVAFARRDWSALVRRGASHDAGRSPLGAPPWRFSAGGRASISGIASGSVQRAPRSQVVMPGGRCPGPPESRGYEPQPQDATPRSAFRIVSGNAPHERGCESCIITSLCSQHNIRFVSEK
jgi:hypothetical protein